VKLHLSVGIFKRNTVGQDGMDMEVLVF